MDSCPISLFLLCPVPLFQLRQPAEDIGITQTWDPLLDLPSSPVSVCLSLHFIFNNTIRTISLQSFYEDSMHLVPGKGSIQIYKELVGIVFIMTHWRVLINCDKMFPQWRSMSGTEERGMVEGSWSLSTSSSTCPRFFTLPCSKSFHTNRPRMLPLPPLPRPPVHVGAWWMKESQTTWAAVCLLLTKA